MNYLLPLLLLLVGAAPKSDDARPNVLFLIADDWSYPHAGAYGDLNVRTPTFDRLAWEGTVFTNAYVASPSCSPSRASILTGRYPHQNRSAGNLWSEFPGDLPNYARQLEGRGYHVGSHGKGWGPGDFRAGGYAHNPAGRHYTSLDEFLKKRPDDAPFHFWFGSSDPHRDYRTNSGAMNGMDRELIEVPPYWPDVPCVRNDMLDYYHEVERFDRECGNLIRRLEAAGLLENTLIIMTSDNGMPFPRAKANLYDAGTRVPLVMWWPEQIPANRRVDAFVNLVDLAPTILQGMGESVSREISGKSLWGFFSDKESVAGDRSRVFLERERHANVRAGDLSYPMRAVRTEEYLYIRNFEPERYPAGDPTVHRSVGQYGDVDNSITKFLIMERAGQTEPVPYFDLSFGKRPAEELYYLPDDPHQMINVIDEAEHATAVTKLRDELQKWMRNTGDLRVQEPQTTYWDTVRYTPTYQHMNFQLEDEIARYRMVRRGQFSVDSLSCQ